MLQQSDCCSDSLSRSRSTVKLAMREDFPVHMRNIRQEICIQCSCQVSGKGKTVNAKATEAKKKKRKITVSMLMPSVAIVEKKIYRHQGQSRKYDKFLPWIMTNFFFRGSRNLLDGACLIS